MTIPCDCCTGTGAETPAEIWNRPGLPGIAYRIGTHGSFKASMLARLSAADLPALGGLTTRDDSDLAIALLDTAAVLGEVLTFYNERIANESYLGTATQWRSLAAMGRLTGYEPGHGLAATAALAFTLEDAAGAPEATVIPAGTRVQSIPPAGALPQVFETGADFTGRPEWNAMRPVTRQAQPAPTAATRSITVTGIATGVQPGELILLAPDSAGIVRQVVAVTADNPSLTTRIDFTADPEPPPAWQPPRPSFLTTFDFEVSLLTSSRMVATVLGHSWAQADLRAYVVSKRWQPVQVRAAAAALSVPPPAAGIFRFRQAGAVFGHNAPRWDSLSADQHKTPYPTTWDDDTSVNQAWVGGRILAGFTRTVQLDRAYTGFGPQSWAVLTQADPDTGQLAAQAFPVNSVTDTSAAAFTMTGKVTQLDLGLPTGQASAFTRRGTTVHLDSQALQLALLPVPGPLTGSVIVLDGLFLGLSVGQQVAVSGQRDDLAAAVGTEVATITSVVVLGAVTQVVIDPPLAGSYVLDSVRINANVVPATHGQARAETLGSGDATAAFQVFILAQPPLTYVASPDGGARSTLQVRVNGVLWAEAPRLFGAGPHDLIYTTWTGDDGRSRVGFGDGITGARLPTGSGNVTAQYRQGIGTPGLVAANAASLLLTRPLGVRSVTNPAPTTDAADPEPADSLRQTAPLHVLTLDRVVSLQDYADYARAFPGVPKAQARWGTGPRGRAVVLTVAGAGGDAIDPAGVLATSLLAALRARGDPTVAVALGRYVPRFFHIDGAIRLDPALQGADVLTAVEAVLRTAFAIGQRGFGQGVYRSEVVAAIQGVPGVVAFDLDALTLVGSQSAPDPLPAATPPPGAPSDTPYEILLLDPRPLAFGRLA